MEQHVYNQISITPEIQGSGDGLQTLIFMNPAYVGFSDNQPPQPPATSGNFVFLNYNSSSNTLQLPHAPPPQTHQHFVGIPFHGGATTSTNQHDVSGFLPRIQQCLSLSLCSQQPPAGGSISPVSGVSNGGNGVQNVTLGSKYLRAAQELLDEVVKVGKVGKSTSELPVGEQKKTNGKSAAATAAAAVVSGEEGSGKRGAELSTAERQHIQMKKAKLVNMLDEVEQRYRQYHQRMQMVISLFEQASGIGSATSYTALALQTISKQFRCLKDSIFAQIRASSKSLGEEDGFEGKIEVSRMKYVDNQIRQQRALQQLGMIQHNAWRPQRGLPEPSVSVLRAWLFEHFLHPYPKDSDKLMLAKQTGLTRNQVSNWFINARVRLWKPMVEEMYMEESKEQGKHGSDSKTEQNQEDSASKSNAPQAKNTAIINQNQGLTSKQEINHHPINHTTAASPGFKCNPGFFRIGSSSEMQGSPKKPRNADMLHSLGTLPSNFGEGFGSYQIGELGMFGDDQVHAPYSGNGGVSLSLGLPHSHRNFVPDQSIQLGRGVEIGESNDFSSINSTPNSYTLNHCV